MMRLLFILTIVIGALNGQAQDEIYLEDGSMIRGKVIHVGPQQVRYKDQKKPDGPTFVVNSSDVIVVRYESGEYKYLAPTISEEELENSDLSLEFGPRIINFNLLGLPNGNVGFSAEYLFFDRGRLGVRVPFYFGTSEDTYRPYNTAWATGLDINYYPLGQDKWSYFLGPGMRYGVAKYKDCSDQNGGSSDNCPIVEENFYGVYVNNGVRLTPITNLSFSFVMGVGFREDVGRNPGDTNVIFSGNVGFRF